VKQLTGEKNNADGKCAVHQLRRPLGVARDELVATDHQERVLPVDKDPRLLLTALISFSLVD